MNFLIRRPSPRELQSLEIDVAGVRGTAIMHGPAGTNGVLASNGFFGFLTRKVDATGPVIADFVVPNNIGAIELGSKIGQAVSVEDALEVEVGGNTHLLLSGAKALTAETAIETELSFLEGKFCLAGANYTPFFKLVAQITPETDDSSVRILAVRI